MLLPTFHVIKMLIFVISAGHMAKARANLAYPNTVHRNDIGYDSRYPNQRLRSNRILPFSAASCITWYVMAIRDATQLISHYPAEESVTFKMMYSQDSLM